MIVATFLNTEEYVFTQAERDCIQAVSEAAEHEVRLCIGVIAVRNRYYSLGKLVQNRTTAGNTVKDECRLSE